MAHFRGRSAAAPGSRFWYHFAIMFEACYPDTSCRAVVGRFLLAGSAGHFRSHGATSGSGVIGASAVIVRPGLLPRAGCSIRRSLILSPAVGIANQLLAAMRSPSPHHHLKCAEFMWITCVRWPLVTGLHAALEKIGSPVRSSAFGAADQLQALPATAAEPDR